MAAAGTLRLSLRLFFWRPQWSRNAANSWPSLQRAEDGLAIWVLCPALAQMATTVSEPACTPPPPRKGFLLQTAPLGALVRDKAAPGLASRTDAPVANARSSMNATNGVTLPATPASPQRRTYYPRTLCCPPSPVRAAANVAHLASAELSSGPTARRTMCTAWAWWVGGWDEASQLAELSKCRRHREESRSCPFAAQLPCKLQRLSPK